MSRTKMIAVSAAAATIGCSSSHVRHLIRTGKIRANLVKFGRMSCYDVNESDVIRIRDTPQVKGYPRGRRRTGK